MAIQEESPEKSATELLVETMEAFGTWEPKSVIVVWTDIDGGITLKTNCRRVMATGMLRVAERMALDWGE